MNLIEQQTLLQEGGFDQKDITAWKQGKIKELQEGGFTNQEIANEFKFEPDTKIVKDYVSNVAKDYLSGRGIIISEEEMPYQTEQTRSDQLKELKKDIKVCNLGIKNEYITESRRTFRDHSGSAAAAEPFLNRRTSKATALIIQRDMHMHQAL